MGGAIAQASILSAICATKTELLYCVAININKANRQRNIDFFHDMSVNSWLEDDSDTPSRWRGNRRQRASWHQRQQRWHPQLSIFWRLRLTRRPARFRRDAGGRGRAVKQFLETGQLETSPGQRIRQRSRPSDDQCSPAAC